MPVHDETEKIDPAILEKNLEEATWQDMQVYGLWAKRLVAGGQQAGKTIASSPVLQGFLAYCKDEEEGSIHLCGPSCSLPCLTAAEQEDQWRHERWRERHSEDDPIVERAICSRHGELAVRRAKSGWQPPIIPLQDPARPNRPVWCSECFDAFLGQHMEPIAFRKE